MPQFKTGKGRARELALLDELWQTPDAALLILYGRRRVGKTRLLQQWLRQSQTRSILPFAADQVGNGWTDAAQKYANEFLSLRTQINADKRLFLT